MRYHFEDFVLDVDKRELCRGADSISIAPQVFDLLDYLIRNREHVVSKDDLISSVWQGRIVSDAALTTRLNAARIAIGDSGEEQRLIKTLPRKGFRFVGAVREEQDSAAAGETSKESRRRQLTLPDKPSIAVLAFTNLSSNAEQEYLADGIVEDIITELSRFSELFVIARNSSFQYKGKSTDVRQIGRELGVRYVLEGSVRRMRDRVRISAQLIDATTGRHRWAESYDCSLEDVFTVQDDVVRTIVTILAAHVRLAEIERSRAKPANSWEAYDYHLKAIDALRSFDRSLAASNLYEARRFLQQSLAIDPNNARSYAALARTHVVAWAYRLDNDYLNPSALDLGYQLARKALEFDPSLPTAHDAFGFALMFRREHEASIAAFERAVALNPNFVSWSFGLALVRSGDPQRAIQVLNRYVRLDPSYAPFVSGILGLAYYMLKDYAHALPLLRDCVTRSPLRHFYALLAATYAQMGKLREARAAVSELMRVEPKYTIAGVTRPTVAFKNAEDDQYFFDGLRKAGLPE